MAFCSSRAAAVAARVTLRSAMACATSSASRSCAAWERIRLKSSLMTRSSWSKVSLTARRPFDRASLRALIRSAAAFLRNFPPTKLMTMPPTRRRLRGSTRPGSNC